MISGEAGAFARVLSPALDHFVCFLVPGYALVARDPTERDGVVPGDDTVSPADDLSSQSL
jgi:hypothetical protein